MAELTHFDADGQAHMVDVSEKPVTSRVAVAQGVIRMQPETFALITEHRAKKGDVLGIARIAGITGAKKTSDLIPLCHPLPITKVAVELTPDASIPGVRIEATVKTTGQTVPKKGPGGDLKATTARATTKQTNNHRTTPKNLNSHLLLKRLKLRRGQRGKARKVSRMDGRKGRLRNKIIIKIV